MTSSTGEVIYKAFAPTIKMMICIGIGFILTKRGIFAPQNAKGVSILSLNVGLPALVFGSMISAFTSDNIKAFGSLIFVALLYQLLGFLAALFIREFFYIPADFYYGIIVLGIMSNWGNLPTAVVQTLAEGDPFDPDTDSELGVAYIAVFILVMNITLFPCGLHKLCAWDFREENLSRVSPLPVRERWEKRFLAIKGLFRKTNFAREESYETEEKAQSTIGDRASLNGVRKGSEGLGTPTRSSDAAERGDQPGEMIHRARFTAGTDVSRKKSRTSSFHSMMESTRPIPATTPLDASGIAGPCLSPSVKDSNQLLPVCSTHTEAYRYHHPVTPAPSIKELPWWRIWSRRLFSVLKEAMMPLTASVILGLLCSVVTPIKALFVDVDGWSGTRIPYAPDGNPPLSFITTTATFLGGMTIPASLILLGASFARLKIPKKWSDLPLVAITAMAAFKMVILPVFGIFVIQALRDDTGLYPRDDKMRIFVGILLAGTPASVNQLVITQLYNPEGTADTLSSFLALQYVLMPVLSTALAAIALFIVE